MNNKQYPSNRMHDFKCFYMYWYGGNTISGDFVINVDISLYMSIGPEERRTIAIGYVGCSDSGLFPTATV